MAESQSRRRDSTRFFLPRFRRRLRRSKSSLHRSTVSRHLLQLHQSLTRCGRIDKGGHITGERTKRALNLPDKLNKRQQDTIGDGIALQFKNAPCERHQIAGGKAQIDEGGRKTRIFCFFNHLGMQMLLRVGQTSDHIIQAVQRLDDERMLHRLLNCTLHLTLFGTHLMSERAQTLHIEFTDDQGQRQNPHNHPS